MYKSLALCLSLLLWDSPAIAQTLDVDGNRVPASAIKPSSKPAAAQAKKLGYVLHEERPKRKLLKGKVDRQVLFADQLMLKGKYSEAADLYKDTLNRNKNNTAAKMGYGMALAKQFKLDGAEEQFDQILAADPQSSQGLAGKALVQFNRLQSSSNTVIKNKDAILQNAESLVKQGLSKRSRHARSPLHSGHDLQRARQGKRGGGRI